MAAFNLKNQLSQFLEETHGKCTGSFAHKGHLPSAPNPGLFGRGLGTVGLPLSERDAVELKKACHQAPFGKGSETIVDTNVRNTWELNADQLELQNNAWQTTLDHILEQVAKALGVAGGSEGIKAELYKLLLYDEGAFFDSHTDTEKAAGMIGTLVIALPSKHQGGGVQASFGGQTLVLETAESSAFGYSYLAWYSDVEHAVRPVTSGHRLVLTYNLIQLAGGPRQLASSLNDDHTRLARVMALWNDLSKRPRAHTTSDACPSFLAYILEHKYTDANLRSDHLKGKDAQQFRALQAACQDQGMLLFLANLEHSKDGSCEDYCDGHYGGRHGYYWKDDDEDDDGDDEEDCNDGGSSCSELGDYHELQEVFDTSITLRTFYRTNGQQLASGIPINAEDIVQDDPFDRAPDKEDYEGYTGNAGASATHFYRNSCIVIIPSERYSRFLVDHAKNGEVDMESFIGTMIEDVRQRPEDARLTVQLTETCQYLMTVYKAKIKEEQAGKQRYGLTKASAVTDEALGFVAKAALQLKQPALFESAATAAKESLPMVVYPALGETLAEVNLEPWQKGFELALSRISKVHLKWEAVTGTLQAAKARLYDLSSVSSNLDAIVALGRQTIENMLSTEVTVSKEDVQALIATTEAYGQGFLFNNILPFVKKHISNTTFTITFLVLLSAAEQDGTVKVGVARNIYRDILADLIPSFKLEINLPPSKRSRYDYRYYAGVSTAAPQPNVKLMEANDIATLLDNCTSMDLPTEREALMDHLVASSKTVDPSAFGVLFIPLLARLVELSRVKGTPLNDATVSRSFFQNILHEYVRRYIGVEPARPLTWAQSRRACNGGSCGDCTMLNKFLTNPQEEVGRFSMAEKRRRHLEYGLSGSGCTLSTERRGSPHTLVVTKTLNNWHAEHKAWRDRCVVAGQSFRTIGMEALKEILGEDYGRAVDVRSAGTGSATGQKAAPATETAAGAVTPLGSMNPWNSARDRQAASRTPLGTISQVPAWLSNPNLAMGQQTRPSSKVHIIDLTED
ncbi:MAG: hypothetical protein Q9211_004054 [Gyalolechia sp. 1 TL-2023]